MTLDEVVLGYISSSARTRINLQKPIFLLSWSNLVCKVENIETAEIISIIDLWVSRTTAENIRSFKKAHLGKHKKEILGHKAEACRSVIDLT